MIARLGQVNQHHFGHDAGGTCTPTKVTHAALRRWLVLALRRALSERTPIPFSRVCRLCGKTHSADLLSGTASITENVPYGKSTADVMLLDTKGELCAAILIDEPRRKTAQLLTQFTDLPTPTLLVTLTSTDADLLTIFSKARVVGGTCDLVQTQAHAITDPTIIRQILRDTVTQWPGYFYAALQTIDDLPYILKVKDRELWLPPDRWRDVIGGTRNPLASDIRITVQTWPHEDGGAIWLYYVVVRDTQAIAIRRFGPGQTPSAQIDERFRHTAITAVDLAKHLVSTGR